jgi:hypothetical protein
MRHNKYDYDAFISHAVEDKIPIANELCAKLEAAGLKIWYSGKELGVGDSIEKTIQNGLNRSRYGIVIFSPTYLAKNWTIREFYTLLAKEIEEHKVILPVLYNIRLDELKNKDLLMADRFAANADKGIDFVVERLVREIKKSNTVRTAGRPWLSKIGFLLILSLLANVALLSKTSLFSIDSGEFAQKFQPARYENGLISAEKFLGDMQGMFSQITNCTCSGERQPPAEQEKTRRVQNHMQANENVMTTGSAKKMTMAVIFQIEAQEKSPTQFNETEENEALKTSISMREENQPFIRVKGHNVPPTRYKMDCLYTAGFAE